MRKLTREWKRLCLPCLPPWLVAVSRTAFGKPSRARCGKCSRSCGSKGGTAVASSSGRQRAQQKVLSLVLVFWDSCCFFSPPPSWLSSPCFPSNYKIIKEPHSGSVQSSRGFSPNSLLAIFLFQLNFLLSSDISPQLYWNMTFWTIFMDNI